MTNENIFFSYSPINGKKTGPYKNMNKKEVSDLIKKASLAKEQWASISVKQRLFYLKKIIKTIVENADYYSELIHKDNGKSKIEALTTEIIATLGILEYYVKKAKKIMIYLLSI